MTQKIQISQLITIISMMLCTSSFVTPSHDLYVQVLYLCNQFQPSDIQKSKPKKKQTSRLHLNLLIQPIRCDSIS